MTSINDILANFEPIDLAQMDSVKLMDRTDTKFSFSFHRLPFILGKLSQFYRVLRVEGTSLCSYKTLYYDTSELKLYMAHHNERANRYKIRHRNYVDSHLGFMEVKFKNNKGRTIKKRIVQPEQGGVLSEEAKKFISETSDIDPSSLEPSVWINYQRITLVGAAERVTIDINLEFVQNGLHLPMKNLAIAEVKQSKLSPSPIFEILKEEKLRETSISKYCLGIISTRPLVKQNNFKQKISTIKKITDDRNIK
ncbi:MAG: polyphosphate polymerase domain-containing protein [Bacteroidota bacterium]